MFFPRFQPRAACPPGAPCTGRCRTRACVATASAHPTPARAVPCWTKPCPMTSCSAALRRTTARCRLAWSTTRRRPTCGVSSDQSVWEAGRQRRSSSARSTTKPSGESRPPVPPRARDGLLSRVVVPPLWLQSGCRSSFEEPVVSHQYH